MNIESRHATENLNKVQRNLDLLYQKHPVVRQDEYEDKTNSTNMLGYPFLDYMTYNLLRQNIGAFMRGAKSDFYAPNASVCF